MDQRFVLDKELINPLSNYKFDSVENEAGVASIEYPSIDPRQLQYLMLKNKFAIGLDKLRRNKSL